MKHVTPADTKEFADWEQWLQLARAAQLNVVKALAAWTDICGFGKALEQAQWNLETLKQNGLFADLSRAYISFGKPFLVGVPPAPSERVLVINDGIARTIDLVSADCIHRLNFLFYIRDLFMHHYLLEKALYDSGLGLRTVLAAGERCQYSPEKATGESLLYYSDEPSAWGKKILEQQFVYNPSEFQMNTAFSLAYTLDSMGSRNGIVPNRVYLEQFWLSTINNFIPNLIVQQDNVIDFILDDQVALSIIFDESFSLNARGKQTTVYRVAEFIVRERLEGEETIFQMAEHDVWAKPNNSFDPIPR